jgi:hypothetical protein
MKYLKMAEGAAGLFAKKVEVLLESPEGKSLGIIKMDESMIPEVFNRPLVIEINNTIWRIIGVKSIREKSILRSRKVLFRVVGSEKYKDDSMSLVPTYAFPIPDKNYGSCVVENALSLSIEEWRQFEFLPVSMNPVMQQELNAIERVLSTEINPAPLLGYKQAHIRESIEQNALKISIEVVCSLLQGEIKESVSIGGTIVPDSFVLRTERNTYYGICKDGIISDLCIYNYESVDDEFMLLTSTFDLVLADWCNATCIFIDLNSTVEASISGQGDDMVII